MTKYGEKSLNIRDRCATWRMPLDQRLEYYTEQIPFSECWFFVGNLDKDGYGRLCLNHRNLRAHRVAYELRFGVIPEGMVIDHLCRQRSCVNPSHMELVSNAENVRRGESFSVVNANKQYCPKGHPLEDFPRYWRGRLWGKRGCKICYREYHRVFEAARRARLSAERRRRKLEEK